MRNDAASPFFSSRPGVAGQPDGAKNSRISQDLSGWRTWCSAWMASWANRRYWRKDGKGRFARLVRRIGSEGPSGGLHHADRGERDAVARDGITCSRQSAISSRSAKLSPDWLVPN